MDLSNPAEVLSDVLIVRMKLAEAVGNLHKARNEEIEYGIEYRGAVEIARLDEVRVIFQNIEQINEGKNKEEREDLQALALAQDTGIAKSKNRVIEFARKLERAKAARMRLEDYFSALRADARMLTGVLYLLTDRKGEERSG